MESSSTSLISRAAFSYLLVVGIITNSRDIIIFVYILLNHFEQKYKEQNLIIYIKSDLKLFKFKIQ